MVSLAPATKYFLIKPIYYYERIFLHFSLYKNQSNQLSCCKITSLNTDGLILPLSIFITLIFSQTNMRLKSVS